MSSTDVRAPAGFVPAVAIAFRDAAGAVSVDSGHPLPTSDRPFEGAIAIEAGVDQAPGRAISIIATVAGTVQLRLADDSSILLPVSTGLSILPFAVRTIVPAGTTATATFFNLH